jgi:four helix bundle protein
MNARKVFLNFFIAEGFRRRGKEDKARFMNTSEASLEEVAIILFCRKSWDMAKLI